MIKINLQNTKEEFEIAGKVFTADFSDAHLQKYFEYGQDVAEQDKALAEKFPDMDKEQDFAKVAGVIAELIPQRADLFKQFFDKCFGEGKGEELYQLVGESTPNMQLIFEAVWKAIVGKMQNDELDKAQEVADKYIKKSKK
jgi:hypothetical protein